MSRGDLRGDMRLVHGFVREHRLADDVADREDVRHVGAHLLVRRHEAAVGDHDARLVRSDDLAIRAAPNGHQHQVVQLRFGRRFGAFETDLDAFRCGFGRHRFCLQHHVVETRGVLLLPHLDEVAVGAGHHHVKHFDDVDARAERRVHGGHFEPDDAAADHQHALRDRLQLQRAGGIDHARIFGNERKLYRLAAGGDDRLLETDGFLVAGFVLARPRCQLDLDMIRIEKAPDPAHDVDLARLGHAGETAGELLDHAFLEATKLVDVDLRRRVLDAVTAQFLHFVHHGRSVQKSLRGNAADVETDTTQRRVAFDQHRFHAEVSGAERRRVATGSRTEHQHFAFDVGAAGIGRGGWGRCGRHAGRRCGTVRRWCGRRRAFDARRQCQDEASFRYLVTELYLEVRDRACGW